MKVIKNHLMQPLFIYTGNFLSDYLKGQLGRSENTVTSYRCCLRLLRDFIEERTGKNFFKYTFELASRDFFLDFLNWVEERGASKATRNQRLACLKTYARYVMDNDFELTVWGSRVISIPMVTAEKPMIGWLREDALKSILAQPEDTRLGTRDLTFMILMYESGARVSEMLDLHIRDINLFDSGSSVRLHGKGKKTREVPIGEKATIALRKHLLRWFGDEPCKADDYVFFTVIHGRRNRMSIGNAERIVKKYGNLAKAENSSIPDRVTPHIFRHTRGTHLLRAKMPLPLIGRFLGHVSLETTKIYTSCDVDLLREAIGNVEINTPEMQEKPVWENDSELLSKLCGLS